MVPTGAPGPARVPIGTSGQLGPPAGLAAADLHFTIKTFFVTFLDCLARALGAETRSVGVHTGLSPQLKCLLEY